MLIAWLEQANDESPVGCVLLVPAVPGDAPLSPLTGTRGGITPGPSCRRSGEPGADASPLAACPPVWCRLRYTAEASEATFVLAHGAAGVTTADGETLVASDFARTGDLTALRPVLEACARAGLPMIVANNDVVSRTADGSVAYRPGHVANAYEAMGATVRPPGSTLVGRRPPLTAPRRSVSANQAGPASSDAWLPWRSRGSWVATPPRMRCPLPTRRRGRRTERAWHMWATPSTTMLPAPVAQDWRVSSCTYGAEPAATSILSDMPPRSCGGVEAEKLGIRTGEAPTPEALDALFESANERPTHSLPMFAW